jgi:hypothetical protein
MFKVANLVFVQIAMFELACVVEIFTLSRSRFKTVIKQTWSV